MSWNRQQQQQLRYYYFYYHCYLFLVSFFAFFRGVTFGYFVSSNRTRFVETCANKLEPELLGGMSWSGRNKLDEDAECWQIASLPARWFGGKLSNESASRTLCKNHNTIRWRWAKILPTLDGCNSDIGRTAAVRSTFCLHAGYQFIMDPEKQ